jgi:hypothetical protein
MERLAAALDARFFEFILDLNVLIALARRDARPKDPGHRRVPVARRTPRSLRAAKYGLNLWTSTGI